jgi:hypothetical protein
MVFNDLKPDKVFVSVHEDVRQRIVLVREAPEGRYYCSSNVFESNDDLSKGHAVTSLAIESDEESKMFSYQVGSNEGFLADIVEAFVARDGYVKSDTTRVVFRLFFELADGSWRQIVNKESSEIAELLFKADAV